MAIWDILQQSNDKNYSLGGDGYNPMQSNALGQDLAPVNPKGDLAAVDPSTDARTPEQFKQDAHTANAIATSGNDDDYHVSTAGNKYDKFDNSALQQGLAAAANYMTSYLATGNVGKAAMASGQALYDMDEKAKRYDKIDELESTGHNPQDIQNYLNSGNTKDLITNKGTWQSGGNGIMFNNLTGETKQVQSASNAPTKTVDLGDRTIMYFADGSTQEVAKGATPKLTVAGAGGAIGIDADENNLGGFVQENGQWVQHTTYANGRPKIVVANATQQKQLNEQSTAGQPDANQQLVTSDLATVNAATPEQLNKFTGQVIGRSETARDWSTSQDPETRKIYQASQRLGTQLGNAAISAAKAAGASGINTEAEIKRFTNGVPQVDYTSPANYTASIKKIQDYADNYKNQLISSKTGQQSTQTQPAKSTGDYSHLW